MTAIVNPIGVEQGLKYVIVGPDGTRAVINDPTDPDFVGYVDLENAGGITGLERAGVRENAETLPEADGGVHGAFLYDRLSFTINMLITPNAPAGADSWVGRQAKLRRATDAMRADALLQWTPSSAPPVQVAFRQQQPTRITAPSGGGGQRPKLALISGVCEDPVVISQAEHVAQLLVAAAPAGGFASPLSSPLVSGAPAAGVLTVNNAGQANAWPVIRLDGPMTNPVVTFVESGGVLTFVYTINAGEYLLIDTNPRRRTVKLNGAATRYSALDFPTSKWAPLLPGNNTVRLGLNSFGAPAALQVNWHDAW